MSTLCCSDSKNIFKFRFKCYSTVTHIDRYIEFILLKIKLLFFKTKFSVNVERGFSTLSCESIDNILHNNNKELYKVEDWRNGVVER